MKEPGLLFDLDGVLINSGNFHWLSWKRLMAEEGRFSMKYEQFLSTFGKRNDEIFKELAPHLSKEESLRLIDRKEELFRQEIEGRIELLEGVDAFLKEVIESDLPHIIASSTPRANLDFFLAKTALGHYFKKAISGTEVAHSKPAPDIFIEAAHRLKLSPKRCIVFEDSPAGLKAGAAAGAFVVALATTHASDQLDPYDMVVPSLGQLSLDYLLERWELTTTSSEQ